MPTVLLGCSTQDVVCGYMNSCPKLISALKPPNEAVELSKVIQACLNAALIRQRASYFEKEKNETEVTIFLLT